MKTTHALHLNMDEAIDRLQPEQKPRRNDLASCNNSACNSWDLGLGFDNAATLAEFGWKDKIPAIESYLLKVQQLVRDSWHTSLDVSGECVDIGAFLEGEPECMLSFIVPERKSVRIVANISARCDADAPRLLNRGIAIAAAVYALQCTGIAVSLSIGEWVEGDSSEVHETIVEINPFGDYLDPGRLAFWLGHPAALRRCFFRFEEQQSSDIRETYGFREGGGYGRPKDPAASELNSRDAIFIPYPETSTLSLYETPERAFSTIQKILQDQGVATFATV